MIEKAQFMAHTYAVIMAGGGGTRLWPVSRRRHPKHILSLIGVRTLFQSTLDRLAGFIPLDRVFVVTTAEQIQELIHQLPDLPKDHFLIEPTPRGTASVVGLAATVLVKHDPQAVMLVLPSDHFIRNVEQFHRVIRVAVHVAQKDYLVTLGITPTFPATGYGYIQHETTRLEGFTQPAYRMIEFVEKPDEVEALRMLRSGDFSWNSGMFIWRAARILEEFGRQMPELKNALDRIGAAWGGPGQGSCLKAEWSRVKSETIDYGIMEHASHGAVLPVADLEWSDVGSWDSLFDVLQPDTNGNVVLNGLHLEIDTHNSLVFSSGKKLIVTIGVEDLIVVDSGDAVLVCHRDQAQQVRKAIEALKKLDRGEYL